MTRAKSISKKAKPISVPMTQQVVVDHDPSDVSNKALRSELTSVNTQNLLGLETYAMPYSVAGIPILRMYTYELVQVMNHLWLANRLKDVKGADNA
jgi:hypothetical protein